MVFLALALSPSLLLFQNCGKSFQAIDSSNSSSLAIIAPAINIQSAPTAMVNVNSQTVTFTVTANPVSQLGNVTCALDNATATACTSPYTMSALADGNHTLVINAIDSQGNTTNATVSFLVDTIAPILTINSSPAAITGSAQASIVFTATDNLSGVASTQCALDGAAFTNCTSPLNLTALSQAKHTLIIRATDMAANKSADATATWQVNLTAATITISSSPANVSNQTSANFAFSATPAPATTIASYLCSIDAAAAATCTSPIAYTALKDGNHTFSVSAVDSSGITSSPLTKTWLVDTVAPTIAFNLTPPALDKSAAPSFQFTTSDGTGSGVASTQCSLDGATFATCANPLALTGLTEGSHTLKAHALDNASNASLDISYTWAIDLTVPVVKILTGPATASTSASATFTFSATDLPASTGLSKVQCMLDTAAFVACTSPVTYSALLDGSHTFSVSALDNAGNLTLTSQTWVINTKIPPTINNLSGPTNCLVGLCSTTVTWTITDTLGLPVTTTCAVNGGLAVQCTSPFNITSGLTASGAQTFVLTATDTNGVKATGQLAWAITAGTLTPTSIAAGQFHTCAVISGALSCWGDDTYGQLGDGLTTNTATPYTVFSSGVTQVATGAYHSCAIVNGALLCWGENQYGQIGNGSTATSVAAPYTVFASGVTQVTAGGYNTCAIVNTALYCWGSNAVGEIGDGTFVVKFSPTLIFASGVTLVSASGDHTCAVVGGLLKCWGQDSSGALGDGLTATVSSPKNATVVTTGVTQITTNIGATCVLVNGNVKCFGQPNLSGNTLSGVSQVSLGQSHACAISSGSLKCWGENTRGQLGYALNIPAPITSASVYAGQTTPGLTIASGVTYVAGGTLHTCAIVNGAIQCWGSNIQGQLGNGVSVNHANPHSIISSGVTQVSAGGNATCALVGGALKCWGGNYNPMVGNNSVFDAPTPVTVIPSGATHVEVGGINTCALLGTNLSCWGNNSYMQMFDLPNYNYVSPTAFLTNITQIAVGAAYECYTQSGLLYCFGYNNVGQVGNGTILATIPNAKAFQLFAGMTINQVSASSQSTCALVNNGTVYCWGQNSSGQIGDGTTVNKLSPVKVTLPGPATEVTAGGDTTCAIVSGALYCWGAPGFVGNGTVIIQPSPVLVIASGVTQVSANYSHTCAVVNGAAQCWGYNYYGALGDGTNVNKSSPVTAIASGVAQVSTGQNHACALMTTGELRCWGDDSVGAVGDGAWTITPVAAKLQ